VKRIFRRGRGTTVPDGTRIYPFLNPADSTSNLPLELFSGASVALGELPAGKASKIHMHPLVTMIVWVVTGRLSLTLKDRRSNKPYTLRLRAEDGALVLPGTFLQLINESRKPSRVLYIVSPAYVFLKARGKDPLRRRDRVRHELGAARAAALVASNNSAARGHARRARVGATHPERP
jgi:hypothetical protein